MAEMQASPETCPKCSVVYSKAAAQKQPASNPKKGGGGFGVFPKLAVLIFVVGAALGGWKFYEYRQAVSAIEDQIRLTSVYVTQIATALDDGGSMTFAEFFDKANKGISEIDGAMVRVSVTSASPDLSAPALLYMKKSQEVIRAISGSMRSIMAFSTAKDRQSRAAENEGSSNEYIRERALKDRREALDDQLKAVGAIQAARQKLSVLVVDLRQAGEALPWVDPSALVPASLYERLKNLDQ
ncbi:hypothetical protein NUV66_06400 [Pseudomonas sp. 32.2.56]|uniref:hypothetical protein n=1 Tax=Pseudomonas sp. 32.2.56 TaxID=2969303 RepID=UPI00215001E3|nr:hypothetical protein [Pseudomonas sp. 32.2.56]MCR4508930.1 hypothetical protein [Pseudomonas sp. 32.2.56]